MVELGELSVLVFSRGNAVKCSDVVRDIGNFTNCSVC